MTQRDEHLWEEEVVEIFLDLDRSGRDYAELEISPGNVVCDVRMIVAVARTRRATSTGTSKGSRRAWSPPRRRPGKTTGWTALAFLPWSGFRSLPSASARRAAAEARATAWRFNVFRVERPGGKAAPEKGAVEVAWSNPPGDRASTCPRPSATSSSTRAPDA